MDKHIEGEPRECHPEKLTAPCRPYTYHKEQGHQGLYTIVVPMFVGHYHGAIVFQYILQQYVTVQLNRLSKEIFYHTVPARGTAVGPCHKSFLRHGVAYLRVSVVTAIFLNSQSAYYLVNLALYYFWVVGRGCIGIRLI